MRQWCSQPDRDEPRMQCGYPLPCPFHTVIADVAKQTVEFPVGRGVKLTVPAVGAGRVGAITEALKLQAIGEHLATPPKRKPKRKRRRSKGAP